MMKAELSYYIPISKFLLLLKIFFYITFLNIIQILRTNYIFYFNKNNIYIQFLTDLYQFILFFRLVDIILNCILKKIIIFNVSKFDFIGEKLLH